MISIDFTIIIQFVNFFLLIFLLNMILFRPLRKLLEERRATIEGGHGRAQELESQIEEKMARYQERLQEARSKGAQERASLRGDAQAEEAKLLGAARETALEKIQQMNSKIADEASAARDALKKETEAMAAEVASKVLGRELS